MDTKTEIDKDELFEYIITKSDQIRSKNPNIDGDSAGWASMFSYSFDKAFSELNNKLKEATSEEAIIMKMYFLRNAFPRINILYADENESLNDLLSSYQEYIFEAKIHINQMLFLLSMMNPPNTHPIMLFGTMTTNYESYIINAYMKNNPHDKEYIKQIFKVDPFSIEGFKSVTRDINIKNLEDTDIDNLIEEKLKYIEAKLYPIHKEFYEEYNSNMDILTKVGSMYLNLIFLPELIHKDIYPNLDYTFNPDIECSIL